MIPLYSPTRACVLWKTSISLFPKKPHEDEFVPFETTIFGADGLERASKFYCGGFQPIYEVETNLGYTIRGTANHPLLSLQPGGDVAWKKIGELGTGDYVALARGSRIFGKQRGAAGKLLPVPRQPQHVSGARILARAAYRRGQCHQLRDVVREPVGTLIDRFVELTSEPLWSGRRCRTGSPDAYNFNVSISNKALCTWLRGELGIQRGAGAKTIPCLRPCQRRGRHPGIP